MALPADTARVSAAEVPVADSIRLYAELVCDSASYLVMENRGSRPVTTDAGYRFEQRVHGRWKSVPVRGRDTGRIVLGAAEFIQAAQKIKRYPGNSLQMNHLVEETGDLLITLEQIRIYLVRDGYGDALNSMIDYKLNRELGRMEQERKDNESKAYHNRRKRNPSKG